MEIILRQNIESLGKVGDVMKVKDGHARNYLIPRQLVYLATDANLKRIEREKSKKAAEEQKVIEEAKVFAEKLSKVSCTVSVEVNDLEKLYGAVTEVDIIKALEDEGFNIDKNSIILEKAIEELGIYEVGIKLHPEVSTKIRLWVTKK